MNQILYTGGKNKGNKIPETQKTIIFLVVFIIIFAICVIGLGANLISKVKKANIDDINNNQANSNTNTSTQGDLPESNIEINLESEVGGVKVIIESTKEMETFSYWWDEEEPTTVEVLDTTYETIITSKTGTHKLNIEVTDEDGYVKTESQTVIGEVVDDTPPELTLSTDKISNYVIQAKDDQEIEKLVIILNDEKQEIEVGSSEIEYKVPIPEGYSIIEVTVYNINGLSATKKGRVTNFISQD